MGSQRVRPVGIIRIIPISQSRDPCDNPITICMIGHVGVFGMPVASGRQHGSPAGAWSTDAGVLVQHSIEDACRQCCKAAFDARPHLSHVKLLPSVARAAPWIQALDAVAAATASAAVTPTAPHQPTLPVGTELQPQLPPAASRLTHCCPLPAAALHYSSLYTSLHSSGL